MTILENLYNFGTDLKQYRFGGKMFLSKWKKDYDFSQKWCSRNTEELGVTVTDRWHAPEEKDILVFPTTDRVRKQTSQAKKTTAAKLCRHGRRKKK